MTGRRGVVLAIICCWSVCINCRGLLVCLSAGERQELPLPERADQPELREAQNTEEKPQENAESKLDGERLSLGGVWGGEGAVLRGQGFSLREDGASAALGSCCHIALGHSHLHHHGD